MGKEKDLIFHHMFGKNYENVWWYKKLYIYICIYRKKNVKKVNKKNYKFFELIVMPLF